MAQLGDFAADGHPAVWSDVPVDGNGVLPHARAGRDRAGGRRLARAPRRAGGDLGGHLGRAGPAGVGAPADLRNLRSAHPGLARPSPGPEPSTGWVGCSSTCSPRIDGWVPSTHIPRTGPLTPESVDQAFAAARDFFATYFPEYPARAFVCSSWLLDPALSDACPDSNLAAFQRRWSPDRRAVSRRGRRPVLRLQPPRTDRARLPAAGTRRCTARSSTGSGTERGWSTHHRRIPK